MDCSIAPPVSSDKIFQEIHRQLVLNIKDHRNALKAKQDKVMGTELMLTRRWIVINNPTPTQLQNGPNCGLVAVNLVGHHFAGDIEAKTPDKDVPQLLEKARQSGFSTHGEMFSATNLATLASSYFGLRTATVPEFTGRDILEHLCKGELCLVPYDKDKNHQPCCLGGSKAHWALLAGLVIPLGEERNHGELSREGWSRLDLDDEIYLLHAQPSQVQGCGVTEKELAEAYVVALHGKSRHQALWTLRSLLESNHNLQQAGDDLRQKGDYVLPPNLDGLKDQIIFLCK